MDPATISVAALAAAIALSCTTRINVGIVAVVLAWVVGVYGCGMKLEEILSGFPSQLFLTLTGVTLLFSLAQTNQTLDRVAQAAVTLCQGNRGVVPLLFFLLGAVLASAGPGNIATAALLAPVAMATGHRAGIPPFLMAIMVGNGCNAGSLSPLAPTGIIVNGIMARIGLGGRELLTWWNGFAVHGAVALAGYFAFGGWRLFRGATSVASVEAARLERRHWLTIAAITGVIAAVGLGGVNVGMAALGAASALILSRAAAEEAAIRQMPWGVILMVSGVTVLISLVEKTQGIDLFASFVARVSTPESATAVAALLTGVVSVYSSTSGVVLPAFLPMVPGLVSRLPGADAYAVATSMNVGGHLVDVSPLSTIGALCIASVPDLHKEPWLFYKLLAWGLAMSVVGAAVCWLFFR